MNKAPPRSFRKFDTAHMAPTPAPCFLELPRPLEPALKHDAAELFA